MYEDPIVAEVRNIREAYAARFNYDLDAICRDLQEKQKRSGRKLVKRPPVRLSATQHTSGKQATEQSVGPDGE